MSNSYDICVIGGGINGTAIALDAASRGLTVLLCEKNDLGCATSSASSKLIHGGIRYLEQYEFGLVRSALHEREILLKKAPHLIRPLNFILPDDSEIRSPWLIRLGLLIYDHLGGRQLLAKSQRITFPHNDKNPLKNQYRQGFQYSDCVVDDARLVVLNAVAASELGAMICVRTEFQSATQENHQWHIQLRDRQLGTHNEITAKALVNAAGPWVNDILNSVSKDSANAEVTLVKGSHIVVPKLYSDNHAYVLQHPDKRVVFIIPYLDHYSLIGTTDIPYQGDLSQLEISQDETDYLCQCVNHYLKNPLKSTDILWSYAGVRTLLKEPKSNPQDLTRDYHLLLNDPISPPLLSVLGGKITTHRILAEQALDKLKPYFPNMKSPTTSTLILPGGEFPNCDLSSWIQTLSKQYPLLPSTLLRRYAQCYGTRCQVFLNDYQHLKDLGKCYGADLYHAELNYLVTHEWARTAEDILWRRTKLGMQFSPSETTNLDAVMQNY